MLITVLVHNNIITITKESGFSYKNFIMCELPEIIDFMQVIWVVVVQDMIVIFKNCSSHQQPGLNTVTPLWWRRWFSNKALDLRSFRS